MDRLAHPDAMRPARPDRTRMAPPRLPARFPFSGRYRAYLLFGASGIPYLLVGLLLLHSIWALGDGPGAWMAVMLSFQQPLYIAFHVLALVAVVYTAVQIFRLFPKAQPPRIGPVRPPPRALIQPMLYAVWLGTTALMAAILAGWILP